MSEPLYVVGDIHGQMDRLEDALDWIVNDGGADARIVFLGDYVDRGPESRAVLDLMIEARDLGRPWTMLLGNHEDLFLRFLKTPLDTHPRMRSDISWLSPVIGGAETLASFGVTADPSADPVAICDKARKAVPQAVRDFMAGLPRYFATQDALFVHAGIRPGIPLAQQDPEDLIWIRHDFLDDQRDHGTLVVHGHTPVDIPCHFGNRINCDGGAGYGRPIYPVVLVGAQAYLLNHLGRSPL